MRKIKFKELIPGLVEVGDLYLVPTTALTPVIVPTVVTEVLDSGDFKYSSHDGNFHGIAYFKHTGYLNGILVKPNESVTYAGRDFIRDLEAIVAKGF